MKKNDKKLEEDKKKLEAYLSTKNDNNKLSNKKG
jgi:hypothetical protein